MQRTSQVLSRWALASLSQTRNTFAFVSLAHSAESRSSRSSGDVPQGHLGSDLSPNICNIGLGRRRDLTLRSDLCLYSADGQKTSLSHILKGKKVIIVGFPGGRICTEKHIPSYVNMIETLQGHGVEKVVAVTVNSPEAVQELASKVLPTPSSSGVELLADKNGGLMRLLGVEIGEPDATTEPRCQRFAAIVDDGILLKLRVEQRPAELRCSDAQSMLKLWECVYPKS